MTQTHLQHTVSQSIVTSLRFCSMKVILLKIHSQVTLKYWVAGSVLTSWGEGASLALVGYPSGDGITIKIPYGVDVILHQPASDNIFSYWVG